MTKILSITWKDVYTTFRDRSLLILMFATPLLISMIVAFVFGGDAEGTFSDLPVAVVNLDESAPDGESNYGQNLANLLLGRSDSAAADGEAQTACPLVDAPEGADAPRSLGDLVNANLLDSVDDARSAVDQGDYVAAVIIHDGFSAALAPQVGFGADRDDDETTSDDTLIEVYGSEGSQISASIIRSVVAGYVDSLQTGNFAIEATVNTLISANPAAAMDLQGSDEADAIFGCAFGGVLNTVQVNPVSIFENDESLSGFAQILVVIGSAQAVFFALFSGQAGVLSIIEERRNGTLQRMIVSPTTRFEILAGKLGGTFTVVIFQLLLLLVALTVLASLVGGETTFIWGRNVLGIVALVLALAIAVCGLGMLLAGLVKSPEQAGAVGSVVNILLAVAGGTFGFFVPSPIREFSLVYWGSDGFNALSRGSADIGLNLLVLVAQGVVFFAVGLFLFNRQRNL